MLGTVLCGLIICLLYYYLIATYNFWKKLNIPGPRPILFFGTMKDVIFSKTILSKYIKNVYDAYKNTPFVGVFNMREPILIIKDPEYIKDVLIKDAAVFSSRGIESVELELLNYSFLVANGTVAQSIRSKLSPTFMPSKLKDNFHMMLKSIERLNNYIEKLLLKNDHEINCTDMGFKLTSDMVGNTLLGIDMKTLTKCTTEENEIVTFCNILRGTYSGILTKIIIKTFPRLYKLINNYLFNHVKTTQKLVDFIVDIIKQRKERGIVKSDLINSMIEFKEYSKHFAMLCDTDLIDRFIAAQVYSIFFAAYESSGLTICNTMYELALNKNIQDKLREEIRDMYARNNNEMHFESINAMPYLKAVINETLRKYPPVSTLLRKASSSYTFKNTDITVPKNQKVFIPLYALHCDPKIYPQPEIYDPERFMDQTTQHKQSMYFIPFGHGPKNCIGERLGILQIKMALTNILRNYKLDVCEKTVKLIKYHYSKIIDVPDTEIFLKMTKIN